MNITYIIGVVAAFAVMVIGMMQGGDGGFLTPKQIMNFVDGASVFITIGCTFAVLVASFPPAALKRLYTMCWGIGTSFRSLKYAVRLIPLHPKKPDLVLQETFGSFLIFNFTQASIWTIDTTQGASKYQCHVNFSDAVFACCAFLREPISGPLPFLRRKLMPVCRSRTAPRPEITGNCISSCYASAR